MDIARANTLQQDIVRSVIDDAPCEWQLLEFTMVLVGGYASFGPYVVTEDERELYAGATQAGLAGLELQEAMYDPHEGTWFSFLATVSSGGEYHFTFNYDEPVEFSHTQVLPESWEREFTDHPRPWARIPDWNYVKQTFTEEQWQRRRHELAQQRAALRAGQE
ncbi:hypothetical protein [Janibacter melonis]|uniref:hypothetical protein n=1 Tax=Janibacter melonis TaxID=262209 RepID=UPI001780D53F|nr:hypothetical protein [Janibacter melonis]